MFNSTKVRPINSLLFVSDPNGGVAPIPVWGAMILSTSSCISVACTSEQDGPTEVILGNASDVDPGHPPAFDGALETPNRAVVVSTVDDQTVLKANVPTSETHVRVWINHPRWPDKVIVGLGD
jgi:hypothetical protein